MRSLVTSPLRNHLHWCWEGRLDYHVADRLQRRLEQKRAAGLIEDTLLLLEHPPVFTLGRSAQAKDILKDRATLRAAGVQVVHADRGGKVTFHGPGQLVGYLVVDLKARRLKVPDFVGAVEEGLRSWCLAQGLDVERRRGLPGLWHEGAKLASIGFHIRRGISRHGFSLNLNTDLRFFDWIIPCGMECAVTSVQALTGRHHNLKTTAAAVAVQLVSVFSGASREGTSGKVLSVMPSASSS